jgi:DNA-binding NtrC family response regulator
MGAFQENGRFRKDLYYRLSHHHVHLPPLRERMDDIPRLVEHFLDREAKAMGKKKPRAPDELFTLLAMYSFPGNVRELRGLISDAVATHKGGWLSLAPFKERILKGMEPVGTAAVFSREDEGSLFASFEILPTIKEASRQLVTEALRRAGGNRTMAAEMLGITRQALSWRLKHEE